MKLFYFTVLLVTADFILAAGDSNSIQPCSNMAYQDPTRPCPANDVPCISNYFQSYFSGTPADCDCGTDEVIIDKVQVVYFSYFSVTPANCDCGTDEVVIDKVQVVLPYLNITTNFYDIHITGLSSGNITDFIVDYDTDVVVLTTVFPDLRINTSAHYYYLRPYDESIQIYTQTYEQFSGLTFVTVFESADNPSPADSFTLASGGPNPFIDIGPCFTQSTDPIIQELTKQITESFHITVTEALLPRAKYIARAFMDGIILCYNQ